MVGQYNRKGMFRKYVLFSMLLVCPVLIQAQEASLITSETEWRASRGAYSTLALGSRQEFAENYTLVKKLIEQYGTELLSGKAVHIDYAANSTNTRASREEVKQGLLIYYRNGKYYLESFRDFVKNGFSQAYYGNGQLYYQVKYSNGKPIGVYKQYKEDGSLHLMQEIVDAEEGFLYYEYYHENGQLASQGNVYRGFKTNEWYYYDADGNLEKIKYFDSRGNIVQEKEIRNE
jgi:antitoxin component YwqK of YwqJK toxin-antitoxin module